MFYSCSPRPPPRGLNLPSLVPQTVRVQRSQPRKEFADVCPSDAFRDFRRVKPQRGDSRQDSRIMAFARFDRPIDNGATDGSWRPRPPS
jgi:hypothetical protein